MKTPWSTLSVSCGVSEDSFCDWYHEAMDDQWGNWGPPRMSIIVTDRKSLMRVRIILRTIVLLQEVWYWHDVLRHVDRRIILWTLKFAMDRKLTAQYALVIYGYEKTGYEDANSIDHYIVKHRIDGEGRLLEGAPLTREVLRKICSLVIPSLQTMEYLPEKVLAYSPGSAMLWWIPAGPRRVFFTKETGLRSGIYPLPAMLFLVMNQTLHTWAVTASVRPEPSTADLSQPFLQRL